MTDTPIYFDMDRRILLNSRDASKPIPDGEIPWFSTRYPTRIMFQAVSCGKPAIVAQQPLKMRLYRGTVNYCELYGVSGANPWFVIPSLAITVGPISVEMRDGLDNVVLQFNTTCVDAIPENPDGIPTVFSNPTSVRIRDEGERIIRQPHNRVLRLQRDASLFLVDDFQDDTPRWSIEIDYGSLAFDTYYSCNRVLVKALNNLELHNDFVTFEPDVLTAGWHEGRITVYPDRTTIIHFN